MVQLAGLRHLVLVDTKPPVSFFAYPGKESYLVPDGCDVHELAAPDGDALGSLEALRDALRAGLGARAVMGTRAGTGTGTPTLQKPVGRRSPSGKLTAEKVCAAVASVLPEGAIVSDEAQTSGLTFAAATAGAPRHDVLALTGGAIGQGLPVAVGAAIACPDRPVLALEADGSALYTIQSLWTMAREGLDVTVLVFNNRSYGILNVELARVGAKAAGPRAKSQLDLSRPNVDFVEIARGLGVPAVRIDSAERLVTELRRALAEPGPHVVEAVIPTVFSERQLRVMPHALRALTALPRPLAAAVKRRLYP